MRHEMDLCTANPPIEQSDDLLGDPLIRDGASIDRMVSIDDALPNFRNEVRLHCPDPLSQSFLGKVAIKCDVFDVLKRGADLSEAELGGLPRT